MTSRARVARALICTYLAVTLYAPALHARTLHWSSIDVTANLEADGRLHVTEREAMVFDGDWNGGERRFRLLGSQRIDLLAMRKIDAANGAVVQLRQGKLDSVDDYAFTDRTTLRWRSRRRRFPLWRTSARSRAPASACRSAGRATSFSAWTSRRRSTTRHRPRIRRRSIRREF